MRQGPAHAVLVREAYLEAPTPGSALRYARLDTMWKARTFETLVILMFAVLPGGAVGCHDVCDVPPGTPIADLPLQSADSWFGCYPRSGPTEEMTALNCCRWPLFQGLDAGVESCPPLGQVDCTKIAPAKLYSIGDAYGGGLCDPGGSSKSEWLCGVFVRDGRVVGGCSYCPPD